MTERGRRGGGEGAETNYDATAAVPSLPSPSPADLAQLNAITAITSQRSSLACLPSFFPWLFEALRVFDDKAVKKAKSQLSRGPFMVMVHLAGSVTARRCVSVPFAPRRLATVDAPGCGAEAELRVPSFRPSLLLLLLCDVSRGPFWTFLVNDL